MSLPAFSREYATILESRLCEPRRFLQVVAGPRQVGKTVLVRQVLSHLNVPSRYASADEPTLKDTAWLSAQWEASRLIAGDSGMGGSVLALDEIQKISGWSETVKRLWDEDTVTGVPLRVVLLESAPLLLQQGLSESLAGRFEQIRLPHWSFPEMREAFGYSLDDYLYYGGYPGAAPLVDDPERWRHFILDSLIETTISRDVLLITRVDKPILLRRLFELGCRYSGQILSYNKMLGQLQDAGNTTTLAHYLNLLCGVGMLRGLPKFAGDVARQRGSSPKFQVMNTALFTSMSNIGPDEAKSDRKFWGRLTESAVGAHLANASATGECELFYWRDRNREVDFVIRKGRFLLALEFKSGRVPAVHRGLDAFSKAFKPDRTLMVGGDGVSIEEFLLRPVSYWLDH